MEITAGIQTIVDRTEGLLDVIAAYEDEIPQNLSERKHEMASLAKLPILLYCLDKAEAEPKWLAQELILHHNHQRGGTGIAKYFTPGLQLSVMDAMFLMVAESDNTIANLLLEEIGGGEVVVSHMRQSYRIEKCGLTDNPKFKSTTSTPAEMFRIWSLIWNKIDPRQSDRWDGMDAAFQRSHCRYGLKEVDAPRGLYYGRPLTVMARLAGMSRLTKLQRGVIEGVRRRPPSTVRSKEGSLDWREEGYRHEMAVYWPNTSKPRLLVAIFTRGWPDLGYSPDHPAWQAIRQIGREIYNTYC